MKKTSSKTTKQRQCKKESLCGQLERLSRRVMAGRISLESEGGTGRSLSGPPYRKIIE